MHRIAAAGTHRLGPTGRAPGAPVRSWARRVLVAVASTLVVLAAVGCVGKTGRNDDDVAPGSPEAGPSGRVVPIDD